MSIIAPLNGESVSQPVGGGSSSTGRVWFSGVAGILATNAKLFWDNTNNWLGIGGSGTPTSQLDIQSGTGTNANFRVRGDNQTTAAGQHFLDVFSGSSGHGLYGYGLKDLIFGANGVTRLSIAQNTGTVSVPTALAVGAAGTAVTQVRVYTPTLTPAMIAAASVSEQTFTVTGLSVSDSVYINGPAPAANSAVVHARVSAADTLSIQFYTNSVNVTPSSGSYRIVAVRS